MTEERPKPKQFILESELDRYLKAGYLGPFEVEIAGERRRYIFNPWELQTVLNADGRCPCKPHDRCLCPPFLKYGVCQCTLFIEVVKSPRERVEKVRRAVEYWKRKEARRSG